VLILAVLAVVMLFRVERVQGFISGGVIVGRISESETTQSTSASTATTTSKCTHTILVVDPRVHSFLSLPSHNFWRALETFALNGGDSGCFLVHTNAGECGDREDVKGSNDEYVPGFIFDVPAEFYNSHEIKTYAPNLRECIVEGKFRVINLDWRKYRLRDCSNYNPLKMWLSARYWAEEFVGDYSSNYVLTAQTDTVLCRPFELEVWKQWDFVGGAWPIEFCENHAKMWTNWNSNFKPTEEQAEADYDEFCGSDSFHPVGNGGLSFRQRNAMIEAIEFCPIESFSDLDDIHSVLQKSTCSIRAPRGGPNEDQYFAVLFKGMNKIRPHPLTATIFASDLTNIEDVASQYEISKDRTKEMMNAVGVGYDEEAEFQMPVGVHKLKRAREPRYISAMRSHCPAVEYTF